MTTTQTPTRDVTETDRDTHTVAPQEGNDSRPSREQRPSGSQEPSGPWLGWLVVAVAFVAAIALVVAGVFGGSDSLADDVAGSDVHLQNLAADIANDRPDVDGSDQRLHNQAADIAAGQPDVTGSDQHLHNLANQGSGS